MCKSNGKLVMAFNRETNKKMGWNEVVGIWQNLYLKRSPNYSGELEGGQSEYNKTESGAYWNCLKANNGLD